MLAEIYRNFREIYRGISFLAFCTCLIGVGSLLHALDTNHTIAALKEKVEHLDNKNLEDAKGSETK